MQAHSRGARFPALVTVFVPHSKGGGNVYCPLPFRKARVITASLNEFNASGTTPANANATISNRPWDGSSSSLIMAGSSIGSAAHLEEVGSYTGNWDVSNSTVGRHISKNYLATGGNTTYEQYVTDDEVDDSQTALASGDPQMAYSRKLMSAGWNSDSICNFQGMVTMIVDETMWADTDQLQTMSEG